MTDDSYYTIPRKVAELFAAIPQDRIERLSPFRGAVEAMDAIASAFGEVCDDEIARTIAFSVGDWQGSAAFLVAVHLCPERFTSREIREGVEAFLLVAEDTPEAARLVDELDYEED